ncbi:SusC/RagA family TonB-linked outer membrane protein [Pedobacter africanus]|uniref:TonB-linked SusC/RagA family outer membrane protein n=1 Tax=Pedobacter africanus TaxID=151894 RepID=A0ACC6KRG7_9SPHI|nr:SusC/RagA family TonB-linked outer membrane protein [Pedobacter africanus]MDR6781945.1 TonB-linked SusC/RagA family outer membrane protein [Pedobacter africanus]
MRLTTVILIASLMQVSAATFGQRITINQRNTNLEAVLMEIRKQSGYDYYYDSKAIAKNQKVNVALNNATVKEALENIFKGLALTYEIDEKTIVIRKKERTFLERVGEMVNTVAQFDEKVSGNVTDSAGRRIAGATVTLKGEKSYHTQTDNNGKFSFATVAAGVYELSISYLGYQKLERRLEVRPGGPDQFNYILKQATSELDQVQVIAYGTTTRRLATGSISSVKKEQIENQAVSNPLQAMEARLPGVYISENSGLAGGGISLQIRGTNTIGQGRDPLYIVDGVPFNAASTELTAGGFFSPNTALGGRGTLSPFDNIPTSDIESIDVLKDADATAIYGSRAANGVVVITTRKGKAGKMTVGANVYTGVSKVTRDIKMLNTEQYLSMRKEAFTNDNITPTNANAMDVLTFGNGYTDFYDRIMGNTGNFTDATLSISGGNKLTQYLVSGNYRHQSTVLPGDFADNKATVRFNIQGQSENNKFSFNFSGAYTKNNNNLTTAGVNSFYALPPNFPIYNADGTFYWPPTSAYTNPIAALAGARNATTENVIGNATLKYNILPGLSFKTDMGYNRINLSNVIATTRDARNPNTTVNGNIILQQNFTEVYTVEPQFNFSRQLGPGKLDALLGGTYQYSKYIQPYFISGTFLIDDLYTDLGSTTISIASSGFNESKFASVFGRLNYSLFNKYILSFNGRRDGSSRFGDGKKFGNFGSVGASWLFTEEGLFKDKLNWLSFGKLRGSYGTLGNDQIADYLYLSLYANSLFATSYNGVSTLAPNNLENRELGWEVTKKLEFAVDLNFINNRIMFSSAWYRNRSNNLIVTAPLASQTGFTAYTANMPALVQNQGWEFTLDTKNIQQNDFSWSSSVNLTLPENKLLEFPGLGSSSYTTRAVVGKSINLVQGYHFTGFIDGVAQFQDLDGSGGINTGSYVNTGKGDYIVLGDTDPKFFGGLNNSFKYKGFQLDVLFQFVKKNGYNIYNASAIPGNSSNVIADVLNQPFKYTTTTGTPAGVAFNLYKTSDAVFGDASFVRLKTLNLSYSFSKGLAQSLRLQNLNVYVRGQNLLTFSKYLGADPETMGTAIPPMKLISFGLQTSF